MIHILKMGVFYILCFSTLALLALSQLLFGKIISLQTKHRLSYLCIRWLMCLVRLIFGITFVIENDGEIPKRPCVIMANHQSALETFFLQLLCQPVSTVMKRELIELPLIKSALKITEPIPLDRSKAASAYRELLVEGKQRLKSDRSVLIFPEGTRVLPGDSVRLNRGAASLAHIAQVPLVCIAHNAGLVWPPKCKAQREQVVRIRIGPSFEGALLSVRELHQISTEWLLRNRDELLAFENRFDTSCTVYKQNDSERCL